MKKLWYDIIDFSAQKLRMMQEKTLFDIFFPVQRFE